MANRVDPDQTAPIGAVCSGSTLFASTLNLSVMLVNYLQQMISADDIFRSIFFLGTLRVSNTNSKLLYNIILLLYNISMMSLWLLVGTTVDIFTDIYTNICLRVV